MKMSSAAVIEDALDIHRLLLIKVFLFVKICSACKMVSCAGGGVAQVMVAMLLVDGVVMLLKEVRSMPLVHWACTIDECMSARSFTLVLNQADNIRPSVHFLVDVALWAMLRVVDVLETNRFSALRSMLARVLWMYCMRSMCVLMMAALMWTFSAAA